MKEYNFIAKDTTEYDLDLFLGPITPEDKFEFIEDEDRTLAHIMVKCNLFPSVGQAKKNGDEYKAKRALMREIGQKMNKLNELWTKLSYETNSNIDPY